MKLIVTRHPAYIDYLIEIGLITRQDAESVVTHVSNPEEVRYKDVITSGLPLSLAAAAASLTTVPLWLPSELRGVELTLEQVREYAKPPEKFIVAKVEL